MRLGKREREAAKARAVIVQRNLDTMATIREEARLTSLRSCANSDRLKGSTSYGYRDNLHGRYQPRPTSGSCRVAAK